MGKRTEKCFYIDETPPAFKKSFKAANERWCELSTGIETESMPLLNFQLELKVFLLKHKKIQNTDLEMSEFLGIDKALQTIQGELTKKASKLAGINEKMQKEFFPYFMSRTLQ